MSLNTTEHIRAFITDVAQVSNALKVIISVQIESPIYGFVNFEVTPSVEGGLTPLSSVTTKDVQA